MRYWWVNHKRTYRSEVPGAYLWSPKTREDGARRYFYECMQEVMPGDVVFSYSETLVKAIGIVQRPAITAPKPYLQPQDSKWSEVGWFVEVEFAEIENPIRPKDFMGQVAPLLAEKYAPLRRNGDGIQGVYLTEISQDLGKLLIELSNANLPLIQKELAAPAPTDSEYEIQLEIEARHLDGDLEKIQITKARRGQGIFKVNVRLVETHCRVTGVTNARHLRASHIKPWAASDNHEKLDGYNGLLLSPHVDHLFDRGFISFENSGGIIVSPQLNPDVLSRWSIPVPQNVGNFSQHQQNYLEYHRDVILQS